MKLGLQEARRRGWETWTRRNAYGYEAVGRHPEHGEVRFWHGDPDKLGELEDKLVAEIERLERESAGAS